MPLAMMLHGDNKHENRLGMDATVTMCHRYTPPEKLAKFCKEADIIVTATGVYINKILSLFLLINVGSHTFGKRNI